MHTTNATKQRIFTPYQVFVIAVLALMQFTVVLDFMIISPLGAILMEELNIQPGQFGLVVSAYAFSAGASGLLAAGFADKFDRKKLLLFFYTGFMAGTILCAVATGYYFLLVARIITGLFGGVVSSIGYAIVTDLFELKVRGRVMGFIQMAFAVSQVLGIPAGLYLANHFGWHSTFWMIAVFGIGLGLVIALQMKPVRKHLEVPGHQQPLLHLIKTVSNKRYLQAFLATTLLATGGFMLMPFSSAFSIHNLGISMDDLPLLYGITGISSMVFSPLIGRASDQLGKYRVFIIGSLLGITMVAIYVNMGITPFATVALVNVLLFAGVTSRMIAASAILTAVPQLQDRGAFMSVNASVQQVSGGIAAAVAGMIVMETPGGQLVHYDTLGYIVIVSMIICIWLLFYVNRNISSKPAAPVMQQLSQQVAEEEMV